MPDCPCSCLPPPAPIYLDDTVDIDSAPPAKTVTTSTISAPINPFHSEEEDDEDGVRDEEQTPSSSTATNLPSTEIDNHIAAFTEPAVGAGGVPFACPDVMPVLILEGELCTMHLLLTSASLTSV